LATKFQEEMVLGTNECKKQCEQMVEKTH